MGDLSGQVAVVTGASRGIGRAVAVSLASAGASLVLASRSTAESPNRILPGTLEETEQAVRALGVEVLTLRADVSREEDCQAIVDRTLARFGRCDILVNNAALSYLGPFWEVKPSRWRAVIAVNLQAAVELAYGFLPGMMARGSGRIVNIGSGAAFADRSDKTVQLPYTVTKYALERFTTALAGQLEAHGVAVNLLRIDEVVPTEAVTYHAAHLKETARVSPEAFGEAAAWLARQPLSYTGHLLPFDELRDLGVLPR